MTNSFPTNTVNNKNSLVITTTTLRHIYIAVENNIKTMLTTLALVFISLWLLGIVTSYTLGGFIHVLLVIAVIVILVRLIKGNTI